MYLLPPPHTYLAFRMVWISSMSPRRIALWRFSADFGCPGNTLWIIHYHAWTRYNIFLAKLKNFYRCIYQTKLGQKMFLHNITSRLECWLNLCSVIPGTQLAITANTEGNTFIWDDLAPPQEGSPIIIFYYNDEKIWWVCKYFFGLSIIICWHHYDIFENWGNMNLWRRV